MSLYKNSGFYKFPNLRRKFLNLNFLLKPFSLKSGKDVVSLKKRSKAKSNLLQRRKKEKTSLVDKFNFTFFLSIF